MAQIVEVNGEPVEFPDDMTDDQIAAVIQGQTATQVAASPLGQEQLDTMLPVNKPTNMGNMPNGAPLPYGMDPAMIAQANKDNAQSNQRNQGIRSNPSMLDKIAQADKQGWIEGILKGAGNTLNEFGQGAEDLVDKYLPESVSNVLNYRPFGGENGLTADQRIARRQNEMEASNEDQLVRTIANPVATTVGSMLPYFVTGRAAELGIDAITKTVSPITRQLVQKSLTTVGRGEGSANRIVDAIGDTANTLAARMDKVPDIPSDFKKRLAYMAKAPAIGAAEGSVNYNQTAGEGALMSTAGVGAGAIGPLRMLDRVENVRDPYTRRLVKEMDREGFSLTPGVRTGNRQMQTEEAGMKNSDVLGDYYHQSVTRPNQRKMTELAGDAIGLDMRGRDNFAPEQLQAHLDDLSAQYKNLEANTTGVIGSAQAKKMGDAMKVLGVQSENAYFLGLTEPNLHELLPQLIAGLERVIKDVKPDVVVTHFHGDTHQDHETVNKATMVAARLVPSLYMYVPTYPSGRTNIPPIPNLVSFFSEDSMRAKVEALSMFATQKVKYGCDDWLKSVESIARGDAWRYGGHHGCAELFQVSRTTVF